MDSTFQLQYKASYFCFLKDRKHAWMEFFVCLRTSKFLQAMGALSTHLYSKTGVCGHWMDSFLAHSQGTIALHCKYCWCIHIMSCYSLWNTCHPLAILTFHLKCSPLQCLLFIWNAFLVPVLFARRNVALAHGPTKAVVTINDNGVILVANQRACTMFGFKPSDIVGTNLSQLLPKSTATAGKVLSRRSRGMW